MQKVSEETYNGKNAMNYVNEWMSADLSHVLPLHTPDRFENVKLSKFTNDLNELP